MAEHWVEACRADEIDEEDVRRFDEGERTFAIYHATGGAFFATDGFCTHEQTHLAEGFVFDDVIECPMHLGQFNFKTGEAAGGPVCVNLRTYPVKVEDGKVFVDIG
jgi:3-phenylpropionate/trans-cinnamate dioxygenase ferredoxin subunit